MKSEVVAVLFRGSPRKKAPEEAGGFALRERERKNVASVNGYNCNHLFQLHVYSHS